MKAILILYEMPDTCWGCPCINEQYGICGATGEDIKDGDKTDMRCPLKPMPNKKEENDDGTHFSWHSNDWWNAGWNACLREIENESNNDN